MRRLLIFTVVSFFLFPTFIIASNVGINNTGCTYTTIQAAVDAASPGDTLQVSVGTYSETIDINGKDLTIEGDYDPTCSSVVSGDTIIDGSSGSGSVFDVINSSVILKNLEITGGNDTWGGGIDIQSNSDVELSSTDVYLNSAEYGGGVYVMSSSSITLTHPSAIRNNTATNLGGGARVNGTLRAIGTYSDIHTNSAPNGGGIAAHGGAIFLTQADMDSNQATAVDGKGGAILLQSSSSLQLNGSNTWIFNNQAFDGGGVYADSSTITLP